MTELTDLFPIFQPDLEESPDQEKLRKLIGYLEPKLQQLREGGLTPEEDQLLNNQKSLLIMFKSRLNQRELAMYAAGLMDEALFRSREDRTRKIGNLSSAIRDYENAEKPKKVARLKAEWLQLTGEEYR